MSFNTFYLNSGNIGGIIDGSNVVIGGKIGILTDTPQYALDVSGTSRSIKLFATTAIISTQSRPKLKVLRRIYSMYWLIPRHLTLRIMVVVQADTL